jgi:hypothetical protein
MNIDASAALSAIANIRISSSLSNCLSMEYFPD